MREDEAVPGPVPAAEMQGWELHVLCWLCAGLCSAEHPLNSASGQMELLAAPLPELTWSSSTSSHVIQKSLRPLTVTP